ncbi:MAG TPA: hypothetical protein VGN72_19885 [Tepidisphaeraceae bacterium]|nr:hypothetical protein [Tepidisphaeraceae bacterium]
MTDRTAPQRPVKRGRGKKIPQLRLHPNGQWYIPKRVHGRRRNFYFGKDETAARERFLRELPDILADRQPVTADASRVTVLELTDRFIIAQEERFRAGDIGIREFDDLRRAALAFRTWAGEDRLAADIPPLDEYRTHLKRRMQLTSFNRYVTKTKKMLRWAYKLKPRPLLTVARHEDDALAKAKQKHVKRERREMEDEHGMPIYSPQECRLQVIAACEAEEWNILSFVLLGLNGGMGQSHISDLPERKLDFAKLYVDWVRTKTEELFQLTVWPVTAEAIRKAMAIRPDTVCDDAKGLLFRTRCGHAWVREFFEDKDGTIGEVAPNDEIGTAHRKFEAKLTVTEPDSRGGLVTRPMKRKKRAFYALRRTFATIGNDTKDKDAVRRIQGQDLTGMDPHYVRAIPIERLRAVTDYVHRTLFACDPNELTLENLVEKLGAIDPKPPEEQPAATADVQPVTETT